MKTLMRLWTLTLDLVMLVMLFAAPVPPQPKAARIERRPSLRSESSTKGDIMTASPTFVRIDERRQPQAIGLRKAG